MATEKRTLIVKEPPPTPPPAGYDPNGKFMVWWKSGQLRGHVGPFTTMADAEAHAALLLTPEHGTMYVDCDDSDGVTETIDSNGWTETIGQTGAYKELNEEWLAEWNSGRPIPVL